MRINLDTFFTQAPITRAKKLFEYVFKEPWRNVEAISTLSAYLPQKQADVKGSKTKYERMGKIIAHFETLKNKYVK